MTMAEISAARTLAAKRGDWIQSTRRILPFFPLLCFAPWRAILPLAGFVSPFSAVPQVVDPRLNNFGNL
jgi:hypothetical protein